MTPPQPDISSKLDELLAIVKYDKALIEEHDKQLAKLTAITDKVVDLFEGSLGSRGLSTKMEIIDQKIGDMSESYIRQTMDMVTIKNMMTDDRNLSAEKWRTIEQRLATLENWRWFVLGVTGILTLAVSVVFR